MQRETLSTTFTIGSKLPRFSLKNVDERLIDADYFKGAKAGLVVFGCNHCPYVKGSEALLIDIVRRLEPEGLKCVMINSNDAAQYPEDSFVNMQAKARELRLPYPYLFDESQEVAKLFDAACTPECYLFNDRQELVYHGTIANSLKDRTQATKDYLTPAIEAALAGERPDPAFVHPIGCSIKWKQRVG